MSSGEVREACGGRLNPWNYEATPLRIMSVETLVGLAAIGAAVGFLAILASSGVDLNSFNALSSLSIGGGAGVTIFSLITLSIGTAWVITKLRNQNRPEQPPPLLDLEPYQPLEDLRSKRMDLRPPLEADVPEPAPAPENFPLLEDFKLKLAEPSLTYVDNRSAGTKKDQFQRKRDSFVENLKSHIGMLIQGRIEIEQTLSQEAIQLDGELTHPAQVEMVWQFALERIKAFNDLLLEHQDAGITPIDIADVEEAFKNLREENDFWRRLLELDRRTFIGEDELDLLSETTLHQPKYLIDQFNTIIRSLAAKPTINFERAKVVFDMFSKMFEIEDLNPPLSLPQIFVTKLIGDIQKLFQYESQEEETETPPLKLYHIGLIREYIHEEENWFYETYGTRIDVYREFQDIETLENVWNKMHELIASRDVIDTKVETLTAIAHELPQPEDAIWTKYHIIRDRMGIELTVAFMSRYFSNYLFQYPIQDQDRLLLTQIQSAYEVMAVKLGCKETDLKLPEPEMVTDNDVLLRQSEFEQICVDAARDINRTHNQLGAQVAAAELEQRTCHMGYQKNDYINGILAKLPTKIARSLKTHLQTS